MDPVVQLLPDDVLACVLRCLDPRSLATSRCICKAWCAVIDTQRLLRADLLPLSLYGIFFMEQIMPDLPKFFTPSTECKIDARLDYLDMKFAVDLHIENHCNGLLLLWERVVNPATRQWVRLPSYPPPCMGMEGFLDDRCLMFDPIVSPHYEVFLIPHVPVMLGHETKFTKGSEWPPSPYTMRVFSSKTWKWEKRSFVREGEAAGTIADMQSIWKRRYTVYWQGALYVHCQNDSIMRITLSKDKYRMIRSPTGSKLVGYDDLFLGKSKKGVYCTLICNNWCRLRIWLLNELCGQIEWVLKSDVSLQPVVENFSWVLDDKKNGPWILHEGNYDEDVKEALVEEKFEWDPDNGIILETDEKYQKLYRYTYFLGFHPYKEIAFLWVQHEGVIAYHLNSSKVQDLGRLWVQSIDASFSYTPCWMGELFGNS